MVFVAWSPKAAKPSSHNGHKSPPKYGFPMSSERKAVSVDSDIKARNLLRLKRIEGQVRGLQKMVENDRYCADILTQLSSVHEALRGVGRELMRNHLRHCITQAVSRGSAKQADAAFDELLELIYKHSR